MASAEDTVVFYCQVGTRSQAAVQKALDLGYGQVYTAGNGLMVAVVLCNKGVCFRKGNGNKH